MEQGKAITNWRGGFGAVLLAFTLVSAPGYDAPQSSLSPKFAGYADQLLKKAKANHEADPDDFEKAWQLAKAYFYAGEFATNKTLHVKLAEAGIAVSRIALASQPESAEANYYLSLNQGQLARNKLLGALSLVRQMEDQLIKAAAKQAKLDHGGPDRCLGLLYRDAPGWPISVGDRKKARTRLLKAFAAVPDYPENILVLLETWLKFKDARQLKADLPKGESILRKARKKLTGKEWEALWYDWERRWKDIQARAKRLLSAD